MSSEARAVALDQATHLEGGDGSYSVTLSREWGIWGPNGGYLAALALRAAGHQATIAQPASFYCHFLRSPDFDRVELDVTLLRRGRRSEALAVRMSQRSEPVLQALVRTAADAPGYEHQQPRMPRVPPPHALPEHRRLPFPFWHHIERRLIDDGEPAEQEHTDGEHAEQEHTDGAHADQEHTDGELAAGKPPQDRAAIVREWTRFRPEPCFEDPFLDAARALILLDTYGWPAAYRKYRDHAMIAPNLDTSVWFHQAAPRAEWLLIDHECLIGHHGLLGVNGRVWSADGLLLATGGAQLCCLPAPSG